MTMTAFAMLLAGLLLVVNVVQALPHVNDCYFCEKCWYDKERTPDAQAKVKQKIGLGAEDEQGEIGAAKIVPSSEAWAAKKLKQNCTECWGCSTTLQPLKATQAFGHQFNVETGASPEWLFYADLADTAQTGRKAIVKVWCVPVDKVSGNFKHKCDSTDIATRGAQHLVALDRMTAECGLSDITIRVWLAPVNAIMPGIGLHIFWYGLWMERAPGLSLNQLAYLGRKDLVDTMIMSLLQEKLNRTQVVRASMFDLLIAQCDRHAQNVFIDEFGNLKLIDNLNSLKFSWKHCSQDSIFLQGTQKNEIIRFGGNLVGKRLMAKRRRNLNPLILLDYRCYVDGGKISNNYPPEMQQCLRRISSMSPVELKKEYGFPDSSIADVLVNRAADMLSQGYEWTLKKGKPLNFGPMRYKWHQPCCKLKLGDKRVMMCGHDWNVTAEFPTGDPLRGGPWPYTYPDPGTYDGNTLWDKKKGKQMQLM